MRRRMIPKLIAIIMLIASLSVAGCTSQQQTTQSTSINVTAARIPDNSYGKTPANVDTRYAMFNATVTDLNAKDLSTSPFNFELQDTSSNIYNVVYFPGSEINSFRGASNLQPGDKISGIVVFEVPKNAQLNTLTYDDGQNKVTINVAGGSNATNSTIGATSNGSSAQPSITPSSSPSSNPSLTPSPTSSPTPSPSPSPSPSATPSPSPSGGATSLTVLFFYDPSCPHCQAIEGQVQNIPTYGGKVTVQWVDTTTTAGYNELHSYGATEIPTFVILNGGSEVGSPLVGPTSTDQLNAQISSLLS